MFDTPDEAAEDFARTYNAQSIADQREYGSSIYAVTCYSTVKRKAPWYLSLLGIEYIFQIVVTVKYSYTKPSIGSEHNVIPNILTPYPIVSTIHTHGNYNFGYGNEIFSTGFLRDIWWYDMFHMNGYLATPGGYLKKYTYKDCYKMNGGVSILANDIPRDPNAPYKTDDERKGF